MLPRAWVAAGLLLIALPVLGEKPTDYVAPSFLVRFGRSLLFLGIVGGLIAVVLYLVQLWMHRGVVDRARRVRYWQVVAVLIFAGSFGAATDALNDEGWNPPSAGSFCLAPLLAVAILVLTNRSPSAGDWIAAVGLTPFFFLGIRWLLFGVQHAGLDLSW